MQVAAGSQRRDPIRGEEVGLKTQKNPPLGSLREGDFLDTYSDTYLEWFCHILTHFAEDILFYFNMLIYRDVPLGGGTKTG